MNERTLRLIQLMQHHDLSCKDVADLLGRTQQTVIIWRCSHKPGRRIIPEYLLELLELKLQAQVAE